MSFGDPTEEVFGKEKAGGRGRKRGQSRVGKAGGAARGGRRSRVVGLGRKERGSGTPVSTGGDAGALRQKLRSSRRRVKTENAQLAL